MNDGEIRAQVLAALREIIDNANRYGLTWRRVPATVVDGSDPLSVEVVLDGDPAEQPVSAVSLSGGYVTASRVMIDIVPPSGMYVIGTAPGTSSPSYRFAGRALIDTTATPAAEDYAGIQMFDVEIVGGGGAGGGAGITAASQSSLGGGGGGGGYSRKLITAADMSWGTAVTIGTGGTGASAANGNPGTSTDFQGIFSATGGDGGEFTPAGGTFANVAGGSGGVGVGGDINIAGSDGPNAIRVPTGLIGYIASGGFSGLYGNSVRPGGTDAGSNGSNARVYGNGGAGAHNTASQGTAKTGGSGSDGLVQMTLYA